MTPSLAIQNFLATPQVSRSYSRIAIPECSPAAHSLELCKQFLMRLFCDELQIEAPVKQLFPPRPTEWIFHKFTNFRGRWSHVLYDLQHHRIMQEDQASIIFCKRLWRLGAANKVAIEKWWGNECCLPSASSVFSRLKHMIRSILCVQLSVALKENFHTLSGEVGREPHANLGLQSVHLHQQFMLVLHERLQPFHSHFSLICWQLRSFWMMLVRQGTSRRRRLNLSKYQANTFRKWIELHLYTFEFM